MGNRRFKKTLCSPQKTAEAEMKKIRKAQPTGYRRPKDVEIQVIYQYLRKELGQADKRLCRTAAFLGAAAGILLFAAAGRMTGAALLLFGEN